MFLLFKGCISKRSEILIKHPLFLLNISDTVVNTWEITVSKIDYQHIMQFQRQVEEGEVIYKPDDDDDNGYFLRARCSLPD